MSREIPANRLDQAVAERAKELRRTGLSVRQIVAQLAAEGEHAGRAAIGEICKALGPRSDATPAPVAEDLADGLEEDAQDSGGGVGMAKGALEDAIGAGNVDLIVALARALPALGREREREIKTALLLRGKATARTESVRGSAETDAERERREKLERLAGLAEGAG